MCFWIQNTFLFKRFSKEETDFFLVLFSKLFIIILNQFYIRVISFEQCNVQSIHEELEETMEYVPFFYFFPVRLDFSEISWVGTLCSDAKQPAT